MVTKRLDMDSEPSPVTSSTSLREIYRPLDSGRFQIRCLSLSPAEFEDPICGILETVSLEDCPKYEAISYVWGQNASPAPMLIDHVNISITQNLDTALRHLRHRDSDRRLWVDALCINQTDLKEKAEQVKSMGLIYSKATKAIVWLGSADRSFQPVMDFLNELDLKRTDRSYAFESKEPLPRRSKENRNDPEFSMALRTQDRPTGVLRGLLELFSRPYWERVWIIQEMSKASDVEIRFGQFCVHLNPLLLASRNLKNLSGRTQTLLRAIVRFRAQEQGYGGLSTNVRMSLFDALIASRYSLATDPRDKVYALLGLTNDGSNLVPLPTYTSSVEKVFHDLTAAIIRSRQRSNVLLLASWAPLQERFLAAARWNVNWAELGYHLPPWLSRLPSSVPQVMSLRADFDDSKLVTKGCFIATITEVQGTSRVSLSSPRNRRGTSSEELAKDILSRVTSDLVDRLAPGFESATRPSQIEITDTLARMVRDVDKSEASADYDIGCVYDVLDRLGSLLWHGNPIWEWARIYNHARASEESNDDDSATNSSKDVPTSTSIQDSTQPDLSVKETTSWLGWARTGRSSKMETRPSRAGSTYSLGPPQTPTSQTLRTPWSPRPGLPSRHAFRFWEDVLLGLDAMPEFKLRFAVAGRFPSEDHLVLVCDGARKGDSIYQVEHSSLPVVLRGRSENFELIGEVCMSRQETGEWDMARFEAEMEAEPDNRDPFRIRPRASEARSLNIILVNKHPRRTPSYESLYKE